METYEVNKGKMWTRNKQYISVSSLLCLLKIKKYFKMLVGESMPVIPALRS
jgi:hypothetical protein